MPVGRTTDERGRVRLRLRPKQSLALRVLASVAVFVLLLLFGPGLLSLGSMRVEVTCTRSGNTVACDVREGVLFGLLHLERHADDVREAALLERDGSGSTRVALLTDAGAEVPVLSLSSDRNRKDKDALVSALRVFLADPNAPKLTLHRTFTNTFTWVGGACSLVWLLVFLSALSLPRYALRPQVLTVDTAARKLELREKPGGAKVVTAGFEDVASVAVTMNAGGWVGKLTEAASADEAGRPRTAAAATPPLHLALTLKSGPRLVVMNTARLTDDEMRAFAAEVATLLGAPLTPEPKPAPR